MTAAGNMLRVARAFADRGDPIFPCRRSLDPKREKRPLTLHGYKDASADPARVRNWWTAYPDAMIGFPTGAMTDSFVLDIDCKADKNGFDTLVLFEAIHGPLPETFTVRTPSGGEHRYFKHPGYRINGSASKVGTGLDIRCDGGYVIAPGSVNARAAAYETINDAPKVEAPDWLLALCKPGRERSADAHIPMGEMDTPTAVAMATAYLQNEAPEASQGGGGNDTTYAVACRVMDFGVSPERAFELLWEIYNERCFPAWEFERLERVVLNAGEHRQERIGSDNAENQFSVIEVLPPVLSVAVAPVAPLVPIAIGPRQAARRIDRLAAMADRLQGVALKGGLPSVAQRLGYAALHLCGGVNGEGAASAARRAIEEIEAAVEECDAAQSRPPSDLLALRSGLYALVDALPAPPPRLSLVWAGAAPPRLDIPELIKGVLPAGGSSALYGPANVGKSLLAIDIALAVATGARWNGRAVSQGAVLYCALEGGAGVPNRIDAAMKARSLAGTVPIAVYPGAINLLDQDGVEMAIGFAGEAAQEAGPVRLIVIDTVSRALAGGNENDSADMGALVRGVDAIRAATGAHVMLIHHSGKEAERGMRGHSLLRAAIDTELAVRESGPNAFTVAIEKQRDGEKGGTWRFEIAPVDIGRNAGGDPVTSAVIQPADAIRHDPEQNLKPLAKVALQTLRDLIEREGVPVPSGASGARGVPIEVWRKALYERDGTASRDTARKQFNRARAELAGEKLIASDGDLIWPRDASSEFDPIGPMGDSTVQEAA